MEVEIGREMKPDTLIDPMMEKWSYCEAVKTFIDLVQTAGKAKKGSGPDKRLKMYSLCAEDEI